MRETILNLDKISNKDLVKNFITNDYMGMFYQKQCAIELLTRVESGQISIQDAISLIKDRT